MKKLIECVPNFSEGRDLNVIKEITSAINSVDGASLLDVDPGASTNRTVVTIVGSPEAVIEAAFRGIKMASEKIDMRKQKGAHPRMGATDVCPLIPIANVTDEEAIEWANKLAKRVGEELSIPVYMYEKAAKKEDRKNLAVIRAGEYEGFAQKIKDSNWSPDYGQPVFNAFSGQTVIGVRDFLIAYNVNLNSKSVRRANAVAFDVREKGRNITKGGQKVLDEAGNPVTKPGVLKSVKGIGWYVEEYGIAQVSMNLTDINVTPLHIAFDACVESAHNRGMRVTGSELIGLLPKKCLIDAGTYYLEKQNRSQGVSEEEIIQIAIKSMGLDELKPFDPREKVIEYRIEEAGSNRLVSMNLREFNNELASDSPAPGGGSVAALCGSLAASCAAMVANLSANKSGWNKKVPFFSKYALEAQTLKESLLFLIDEDTRSFNAVMDSYRLPKGTEEEKAASQEAIQNANEYAAQVPIKVMKEALRTYRILKVMARKGIQASITDAGVGAICAHAAVEGAGLNVMINLDGIDNVELKKNLGKKAKELIEKSRLRKQEIMDLVNEAVGA